MFDVSGCSILPTRPDLAQGSTSNQSPTTITHLKSKFLFYPFILSIFGKSLIHLQNIKRLKTYRIRDMITRR